MFFIINIVKDLFANPYISGILASLIAIFIVEAYKIFVAKFEERKFKSLFGSYDKSNRLYLIQTKTVLRQEILSQLGNLGIDKPEFPMENLKRTAKFKNSGFLTYSDSIALKFVLDVIASKLGDNSTLIIDSDLHGKSDISFISIGYTDYTNLVLQDSSNTFLRFNSEFDGIESIDKKKVYKIDGEFDYGFIIKIHPKQHPKKIWILVAGISEPGTRGAGWYLSNKWQMLSKKFKNKDFGILLKVRTGFDESALEVTL